MLFYAHEVKRFYTAGTSINTMLSSYRVEERLLSFSEKLLRDYYVMKNPYAVAVTVKEILSDSFLRQEYKKLHN